ncbi:hypothetical protein [Clostridium sp.]|uniref:hypothetical protein n=1 Tax=Clostridium sp. TaxID=1506 RepID=UPI0035212101
MSSKKNNVEKYNNNNNNNNDNNDDLTFIPLNIDSSLAPNSTKFPLQIEGISVTKTLGTISLGFPNLNINPTPMPLTTNPVIELAPLTPYPKNIPTIDSNESLNTKNNNINTNNKIIALILIIKIITLILIIQIILLLAWSIHQN